MGSRIPLFQIFCCRMGFHRSGWDSIATVRLLGSLPLPAFRLPRRLPSTSVGNLSASMAFNILWLLTSKQLFTTLGFVIMLISSSLPLGLSQFPLSKCNNGTEYAEGSAIERNLNSVLDRLVRNTPRTRFKTSSYGQSPNKIYGLLQCRGDTSETDCSTCSQNANLSIREDCGNAIGGRVWLDLCYLRYENYSFFSRLDPQIYWKLVNTQKKDDTQADDFLKSLNISNPGLFRSAILDVLSGLVTKALAPANKGFAYGSEDFSFGNLYGMVQCFEDLSADDCKSCLSSAITAISNLSSQEGARTLLGSCSARYEIYDFALFYGAPSPAALEGRTSGITVPHAKTPTSAGSQEKSSKILPITLGAVGAGILALMVFAFATRQKLKSFISRPKEDVHENVPESLLQKEQTIFDLETLRIATGNFHSDNKLGEGGFGAVYKGRTSDGMEIAVKKLSLRSRQGQREFMNEVEVVAKIRHRNLVKLLGCCAKGEERLLVYEYLPNKSLDAILFERQKHIDWQQRFAIILGIARGLLYLHHDSQPKIIHRDIKASNILLDDKLNPKISDFGLARIFLEDESHVSTKVAGTFGYMAPEYAMHGQLSVKADVYSFGVLLLEIVSGRKNTDLHVPPEKQSLLGWAWRLHKRGDTRELIDPTLDIQTGFFQEQILRCIHVGLLCAQAQAGIRPQFSDIISMTSNHTMPLPHPKKPAFLNVAEGWNSKMLSSNSGQDEPRREPLPGTSSTTFSGSSGASSQGANFVPFSRNEASVSDIEPR